jgi:hypothetical protein
MTTLNPSPSASSYRFSAALAARIWASVNGTLHPRDGDSLVTQIGLGSSPYQTVVRRMQIAVSVFGIE